MPLRRGIRNELHHSHCRHRCIRGRPARSCTSWLAHRSLGGANVTGEWAFNVTTDQGGGTPTITFKQDGEKLTGKYVGQLGSADLTGTVKGDAIHFTFTIDAGGQAAPVTYDGTVEKNTMKGKLDIGGMVNGTFTATKK
jgi:hypothetical protein